MGPTQAVTATRWSGAGSIGQPIHGFTQQPESSWDSQAVVSDSGRWSVQGAAEYHLGVAQVVLSPLPSRYGR